MELLAPAGSYESLMAAIQAGADSVYFGIEKLNMRSRSSFNFTLGDLKEISAICKKHNIRSYITLNTVMYEEDMQTMREIVDAAEENRIDAIIASDQAVINYVFGKAIALHLSTQLSISNIESVKFYAHFSDVMVLARELSLKQIKSITDGVKHEQIKGSSGKLIRIEVFGHGALCMAISGKCFLSLHMHNASANRGACYQICRREFTVKDDSDQVLKIDNKYIMSPKDLCTIGFLDQLVDAGIDVLKIEGRGRSPEYVKTTVSAYREALSAISNNQYSPALVEKLLSKLETVFNRGFWNGHYLGDNFENWNATVYGSRSTQNKIHIGKGIKYFKNIGVGEFVMETGTLDAGDKILIIGPTTGVIEIIAEELRFEDQIVSRVTKGDNFSMKINHVIRNSDKLYKLLEVNR